MPCTQGKRECGSSKSWQSNNSYFLVYRKSSFSAYFSVPVNGSGSQYTAGTKRTFSIRISHFFTKTTLLFPSPKTTKLCQTFYHDFGIFFPGVPRAPRAQRDPSRSSHVPCAHAALFSFIVHFHFFRFLPPHGLTC